MSLPPIIKSPAFLTGLGVAGSGAVGIGGWQLAEGINPTADRQLSGKGLMLSPAPATLMADTSNGVHDKSGTGNMYHLETYGCFGRFFPGVAVKHDSVSESDVITDPLTSVDGEFGSGDPIGCTLMNLSYQGTSHSGRNTKYIFKSETTVKNERFGWALWAGAKDMTAERGDGASSDSSQTNMSYYLIFLRKDADNWSILGGYSWMDFGASTVSYIQAQLRMFTPEKED